MKKSILTKTVINFKSASGISASDVFNKVYSLRDAQRICEKHKNHSFTKLK